MAPHRFHGYAPQGNGRERTYREIRVASLHHTGAGTRRDLVGITACHTIGQMDCPGHAFGGMVGRGYRKTLRETREAGRTRTPRTGGTRHAVHGLSHAAGYGIGDKADPGTAEGGEESLPKIVFYEEFIENRDWFKSTRIADELGISPDSCTSSSLKRVYASTRSGSGWSFLPAGPGNAMCLTRGRTAGARYILSAPPNDGHRPDGSVS